MTFAAPAMLGLLFLIPLVLLLHLRRRRKVTVGTLVIWRRIAHELPPRTLQLRNLMPNRSLVLQLLALTALVLALARPQLGATDGRPEHLIAIVDRSIAMGATDVLPSRFEAALEDFADIVGSLPGPAAVSLVAADGEPMVVHARRPAGSFLESSASSLEVSALPPPHWPAVAEATAPLLRGDERATIVAFTDRAQAPVAQSVLEEAFPGREVRAMPFGGAGLVNATFVEASATPFASDDPRRWRVSGTLEVTEGVQEPVPIQAFVRPNGSDGFLNWDVIEVNPDRSGRASFDLELEVPGPALLELRIPEDVDELASDNRRLVSLVNDPPIRVLLVGPGHAALERALLAIPDLELELTPSLTDDAAGYDLVIVDGVDVNSVPRTSVLWLGVAPPGLSAERLENPAPTGWRSDHPLWPGAESLDLRFANAFAVPVLRGADVLLEAGGAPLLQARTTDHGRQILLAFDLRDSGWPALQGFPAFVAAAVDWAVPDRVLTERMPCLVGKPCGLPRAAFGADWQVRDPHGTVVSEAAAIIPLADDPLAGGVWPTGAFEMQFRPEQAGLYTLETPGPEDARPLPVTAGARQAAPVQTDWEPAGLDWEAGANAIPLVRLLLAVALALIVADALLSGLGSERFLRRSALLDTGRRHRAALIVVALAVCIGALALAWFAAPRPVLEKRHASAWIGPTSAQRTPQPGREYEAVVLYGHEGGEAGPVPSAPPAADVGRAIELALASLSSGERVTLRVQAKPDDRLPAAWYGRLLNTLRGRSARVELSHTPMPEPPGAQVTEVILPERMRAGDTVELTALVASDPEQELRLRGSIDGDQALEVTVPAGEGITRHTPEFTAPSSVGSYLLRLQLVDENEEPAWVGMAGLEVLAPVSVLLLSSHQDAAGRFAELLELHDIEVQLMPPRRTPVTLERLSPYDLVILLDVAAGELHTAHQELLAEWVASRGGGLIILGGEQAFGAGGYFRTPLEEVSPLSALIPEELPEATLVFVLDRSGSMQAAVGSASRLEIAKVATMEAFDLLAPESLIGIVAFDDGAEVIAPILPLGSGRRALEAAIGSIRAGGGTSMYPALVAARELLQGVESATRHVIVLTDGLSQPGDFAGVLEQLQGLGASTSFIGIGDGADRVQLSRLAGMGGGAFHLTRDVRALPAILAQEAMQMAADPVEVGPLQPEWVGPAPAFLRGIDGEPPPLRGFVRTTPKDEAVVHLLDDSGEFPLLASWRYGIGRSVAFASQAVGPWAVDWSEDDAMQSLWPQVIRWGAGEVRSSGLTLTLRPEGSLLELHVDAMDEELEPVSGLTIAVELVDEQAGERLTARRLIETSPGSYQSSIIVDGSPRKLRVIAKVEDDTGLGWRNAAERIVVMPSPLTAAPAWADGRPTLGVLAAASSRSDAGGDSAFHAPWKLRWVPDATPWILMATLSFLLALLLRYLPLRDPHEAPLGRQRPTTRPRSVGRE